MKVDFHYLLEFSYLFSRIYDNKTNFNLYYSYNNNSKGYHDHYHKPGKYQTAS